MNHVYLSKAKAEAGRIDEDWGSLTWLASHDGTGSDITVGRVIIKQGMSNPRHSHPNCSEVLYLLEGILEHDVGGEKVLTGAGDTIIVTPGVPHVARNVGDGDADMIVAYPSGQRGFDLE
ncbi:MAG: cupin domain-containing protein [Anaerolineae bacterium]|jgi:quercetin dioxygenase-like cupin family protein